MGLAWVVMGVWWRGVGRLGSFFFVFHFLLSSGFLLCVSSTFCFSPLCGNDRHTDTFPALLFLFFYYSSNLTFSLAPGWAFVESEDWRKDVQCAWSGCGGDAGMCRCFFVLYIYRGLRFLLAFFFSLFSFALRCMTLHCAPPQTVGYTPTTHGSVRDQHLISLVGGASQEGGGG